jgi:prephenate dehydratase
MKIFYLGPPKTFSEQAATVFAGKLGGDMEFVPQPNFQQIAQASAAEPLNTVAVFPYYNFLEGLVQESLDLIFEYGLFIQGACRVPIAFFLGGFVAELSSGSVYSHGKALAQCSDFLKDRLPEAVVKPVSSTAEAARLVKELKDGLAIASREALHEHGLPILASDIGNLRHGRTNFTDFLLVSADCKRLFPQPKKLFRTMVAITPKAERVGLLAEILAQFAFFNLNVAKIHSRPAIDPVQIDIEPQMFYLEVMSSAESEDLQRCTEALNYRYGKHAVRHLGSFPALNGSKEQRDYHNE